MKTDKQTITGTANVIAGGNATGATINMAINITLPSLTTPPQGETRTGGQAMNK